jgi:hypothetical protein
MRPRADASVLEPLRKRGTRDCLSEARALALWRAHRAGPPVESCIQIPPQDEYDTGKTKG